MTDLGQHAAARIKTIRHAKGITQQQLAAKVGTSKTSLNRMERGHTKGIYVKDLPRYAHALGVTIQDLIGNDDIEVTIEWVAPSDPPS